MQSLFNTSLSSFCLSTARGGEVTTSKNYDTGVELKWWECITEISFARVSFVGCSRIGKAKGTSGTRRVCFVNGIMLIIERS